MAIAARLRLPRTVTSARLAVWAVLGIALVLAVAGRSSASLPVAFGALAAAITVALLIWLSTSLDRPAVFLILFVGWLSLQNLVAAIAAVGAPPWAIAVIVGLKEALYVGVFGVACLRIMLALTRSRVRLPAAGGALVALLRAHLVDVLAIAFIALVAVSFLLSDESLEVRLLAARRFASLPLLFLIGRMLLPGDRRISRGAFVVIGIATAVALFGLVEYFILGNGFWRDQINILEWQRDTIEGGVQSDRQHGRDGLPLNWWTNLVIVFRRLVSSFAEPTTLAIFLAFALALVAAFLFARRVRAGGVGAVDLPRLPAVAAAGAMLLALVLTFGKGGWAILVVAVLFGALRISRHRFLRLTPLLAIGALGAIGLSQLVPGVDDNVRDHVSGLITGALHMLENPLGSGLGSTGFWGEGSRAGTDSTAGTVAGQLGILGFLIWLGWFAAMVWSLTPSEPVAADARPSEMLRPWVAGAVTGLLALSFVSTSAAGLLGSSIYMLFGGWLVSAARGPGIWLHARSERRFPDSADHRAPAGSTR